MKDKALELGILKPSNDGLDEVASIRSLFHAAQSVFRLAGSRAGYKVASVKKYVKTYEGRPVGKPYIYWKLVPAGASAEEATRDLQAHMIVPGSIISYRPSPPRSGANRQK